jgi:AraC-like DNA-binding protein
MKTVSNYSENNILVIPQSLYGMTDVVPLLDRANAHIFYKSLEHDLTDVEFYTNTPCLVYIESGQETITTSENKTYELHAQTAIFLPQGINLHSDYVKTTTNLKAYLVFFEEDVIDSYLTTIKPITKDKNHKVELLKIQCDELINIYFNSVQQLTKRGNHSKAHIKIKLLELLHLLAIYNVDFPQNILYSKNQTHLPKRNITRLLNNSNTLKLTIKDLANLSGKSMSTFNRDFKSLYNMTPNKWLQEKRLARAHKLLIDTDLSVTHIATDVGYENVSHFIKSFKSKYKTTPKQFKQNN